MLNYRHTRTYTHITTEDGIDVAHIGPTYLRVPDRVVFYPGCPAETRAEILSYLAHQVFRGTLIEEVENELNVAELENELRAHRVTVVDLAYLSADGALDAAAAKIGIPSLRMSLSGGRILDYEGTVTIRVGRDHRFEFWKSVDIPRPGDDDDHDWRLHLVAGYHPIQRGKKEGELVNGCTDANISGRAIRSILAPPAAVAARHDTPYKSSTWSHLRHPFCAAGRQFSVRVDTDILRTEAGVDEFVAMLKNALGLTDKFVAISGGFNPPLQSPHNRLLALGLRPVWGKSARGSEASCVWEYRVLAAEKALDAAFIPKWFYREGWLGRYESAAVRHGLY